MNSNGSINLCAMQRRVAALAIGPSSLRNMVGPGGVSEARNFCSKNVDLKSVGDRSRFVDTLNRLTDELAGKLPPRKLLGGNLWGPARKQLNIFLSDATYNVYLRNAYGLAAIEGSLEIPVDSLVADGIANDVCKFRLRYDFSAWRGVIHLTPALNAKYQEAADDIAIKRCVCYRAHLNLIYWRSQNGEETGACITADQSNPL